MNTRTILIATISLAAILPLEQAWAQSSIWTNPGGGSWASTNNWASGVIASGSGNTANFATLALSSAPTVTLDGAFTISDLTFGDLNNAYGLLLKRATH